ncbi:MAG TPA: ABC transporter permease [Chloroflexota bacterium]|nr:ABC transporter permease [Chloroflexota bacterium]
MNPLETLRVALGSLTSNKMRSSLTMLGIIIGVGAVIALMSVGRGAQASVTQQIQGMGTNLLFITPGATNSGGVRSAAGSAPTLTYEDALAIGDGSIANVSEVAPEMGFFGQVIAGGNNVNTRITGITPEYEDVRNFHAGEGQFISKSDMDTKALVVILGSNVASQLFPDGNAVDQSVNIAFGNNRRLKFRVIGVLESKGAQAMGNQDDTILMPLTTLQQKVNVQRTASGLHNVSTINVQLASDDPKIMTATVADIGNVLRQRHKAVEDDFTIRSQDDMLATANQITGVMTLLLGAIAGISLVVGGIGIMNIMLVSVTERTREIGIRKAIGAKRKDILTQFLVESVVVSAVGGIIGILIGLGISQLISGIDMGGQKLQTVVAPDAILLAFGVSTAIGVFFGIYPANRAASLNPIDALRYE